MDKLKSLGRTIASNKNVIIKRTLQGAGLAAGYFVATAIVSAVKGSDGDTIIIEGDAVIETDSTI